MGRERLKYTRRWACMLGLLSFSLTDGFAQAQSAEPDKSAVEDIGPPPVWNQFKALTEASIRNSLLDPDSAKFEWPYALAKTRWQKGARTLPIPSRDTVDGYLTCGFVNAKNRFGGYVGRVQFVSVYLKGQLAFTTVDDHRFSTVEQECGALTRSELLTAADDAGNPLPIDPYVRSVTDQNYGLTFTHAMDGAYITSVDPNGLAAKAGVKPDMTVTKLDTLELDTMSLIAVVRLLDGLPGPLKLTMADGHSFKLARPHL